MSPLFSKNIPLPLSISDEYRSVLENARKVSPWMMKMVSLSLDDVDSWKTFIAERDAEAVSNARSLASAHNVTITERAIGDVRVYDVISEEIDPTNQNRLLLYVHGGSFILKGGEAANGEAILIAARNKIPVLSIDYRMAPDYPAPAAMDDVISVWQSLLESRDSATMAMGGTSAGANLSLVATARMKELNLPLPGALYIGTPAVDVALRGDSRFINQGVDRVLVTWTGIIDKTVELYRGDFADDSPYLSPIYADVSGFPPTYLISGTRDLLLSDTVKMHRKLRQQGVSAELHIYEAMSHAEYALFNDTPESEEHYAELGRFLSKHLQ